jgi:hypothetical protein
MRDTAKDRKDIIEHLQAALVLCEPAGLPLVGFLIEQALEQVRAADWGQGSTPRA